MDALDAVRDELGPDAVNALGAVAAKRIPLARKRLGEAATILEELAALDAVATWLGAVDAGHAERAQVLRTVLGELGD
jgi:hypothetical protein